MAARTNPEFASPPWFADAACRGSTERFFSADDRNGNPEPVIAICRQCPALRPCLEYALLMGPDTKGIWGGTTSRDRQRISRERRMKLNP
jgi:hypothetical protein